MSSTVQKLSYLAGATRFRRISEKLYSDGSKVYQKAGIPFKASWFPVYYILALAESPLTILQIADQMDFSHITVKNILRELEKHELVHIEVNPADKRSRLVSLSVKGQKLIYRLKPIWISFAAALKDIFHTGHPDFMNILERIDQQIEAKPIHKRIAEQETDPVTIIDYRPGLYGQLQNLVEPGDYEENLGHAEEVSEFDFNNPHADHFMQGGFFFYARNNGHIVGSMSLKRLDEKAFEFTQPYIHPEYHTLEIEKLFLERCICRCIENQANELWGQAFPEEAESYKLFQDLGFEDSEAHPKMELSEKDNRAICLKL